MQKIIYEKIENYMLQCMTDSAHDSQHIYRVLYAALDIAKEYPADQEILITACLLHDIGREAQFHNPKVDHALAGAETAYDFLIAIGWAEERARHVKACIATHRYRNNNPPESIEAKILFDADKLDITGAIGIVRTLAYQGALSIPLYSVDEHGNVSNGGADEKASFFHEYHWKLEKVYDKFFTDRARQIAEGRRKICIDFFESLVREVAAPQQQGLKLLHEIIK